MSRATEEEFLERKEASRIRREERAAQRTALEETANDKTGLTSSEERRIANIKLLGPDRTSACVTGGPRMSPEAVKAVIDGLAAQTAASKAELRRFSEPEVTIEPDAEVFEAPEAFGSVVVHIAVPDFN